MNERDRTPGKERGKTGDESSSVEKGRERKRTRREFC